MDEIKNMLQSLPNSEFTSPVYEVKRIPVWDIVGQSVNPNTLTGKAFAALTQSIFNQGYAMSITCQENSIYDPESDTMPVYEKIKLVIEGGENDARSAGGEYATQVSDESIRKMFKIQIVDGQQRSSVLRVGTKLCMEDNLLAEKAEQWKNGNSIPEKPGDEMLKYIAWREGFSIPCAILRGKTDAELMSATILMNTARGSHSLDSMKDIVYNLINVAGMSEEWVSRNLFLDMESIKRMQQLSGLKASMQDVDDCSMGWNPDEDDSYGRKVISLLTREAAKWVELYRQENSDNKEKLDAIPETGTAVEIAKTVGFADSPVYRKNEEAYLAAMERMQAK